MTQERALAILKTGANIFLTGEPGAGKTHTLNQYLDFLSTMQVPVAVTASTGIAATHIGGLTIHAWSGIGARDNLSDRDLDAILQKEHVVKRIQKTRVLVIDEVSMLSAEMLDMVDRVLRTARGSGEPFGGIQIVLVGDFYQLPPITPFGTEPQFAFQSRAWKESHFLILYLEEQYRHEDELLTGLLASIRSQQIEEDHFSLLAEQKDIAYEGIEPTRLFTHNKDVDALNTQKLSELRGNRKRYTMKHKGARALVDGLKRNCLSPEALELVEDAMVMCTKNNFEAGFVNGTLGRVIGFSNPDNYPIIETASGEKIVIEPLSWSIVEDGKIHAEITQVPLRLAWAITIHKSQGMSLDAAEIDLRNAFAYGQGYVALSRVRTLAGMKLLGVGGNALAIDPRVVREDVRFREQAKAASEQFEGMDEDEIITLHKQFVETTGGTWTDGESDISTREARAKKVYKEAAPRTEFVTKQLYLEGKKPITIARTRELTPQTIWGHIETLIKDGQLSEAELDERIFKDFNKAEAISVISDAIEKCGVEKLKPIFEHLNEVYPYELIRVVRALYSDI